MSYLFQSLARADSLKELKVSKPEINLFNISDIIANCGILRSEAITAIIYYEFRNSQDARSYEQG